MERLTKIIDGYAHGAEGVKKDRLTGSYCRGKFEATACVERLAEYENLEEQLGCKNKIIEDVIAERKRQDEKWGEQNHSPDCWATIIGEEYGEICKAVNEFGFNPTYETEQDIYTETVHTMASCMAMLECMERMREQARMTSGNLIV